MLCGGVAACQRCGVCTVGCVEGDCMVCVLCAVLSVTVWCVYCVECDCMVCVLCAVLSRTQHYIYHTYDVLPHQRMTYNNNNDTI